MIGDIEVKQPHLTWLQFGIFTKLQALSRSPHWVWWQSKNEHGRCRSPQASFIIEERQRKSTVVTAQAAKQLSLIIPWVEFRALGFVPLPYSSLIPRTTGHIAIIALHFVAVPESMQNLSWKH